MSQQSLDHDAVLDEIFDFLPNENNEAQAAPSAYKVLQLF